MMALDYKFIIFFVFVTIFITKTRQDNCYDFKFGDCPALNNSPRLPIKVDPCIARRHSFNFSDVGLQKIGRDFIKSDDIILLRLDYNNISEISSFAFDKTPNLKYLDLSGNRIPKEKLFLLSENVKLEVLIIENNRDFRNPATNAMEKYDVFPHLRYLHLGNNQLRNFQIPYYIAMPSLTALHLENNGIDSTDVVFENIPMTLSHLYVSNNSIDEVKPIKLRSLQTLIMDNNVITQICYQICTDKSISLKDATNLQNLSLSNNLISEITIDAFRDMTRLAILNLSGNKISNVADSIFNNTKMIENLSLANNKLVAVPNVCLILHLKSLDLSGNRISAINSFCALLRQLEYLYLSNNIITTIEPRAFYGLLKIKYMDLSGNQLIQLPEYLGFEYLSIHELHLERNNFTKLSSIPLRNIKTLRDIYLDENPISTLRAEDFHSLPRFLTIHLKHTCIENKSAQCFCDDEDKEDNDENESEENYDS